MRVQLTSLGMSMFLAIAAGPLWAAEPVLEKANVFEAGTGGYAHYRIPGIVVTSRGTVLVYCEARKNLSGDWGHIDILLRRSTDGGKTWEPARQVVHLKGEFQRNPAAIAQNLGKPGEITVNNPVAIADAKTGAVHFLYCVEYARCFYQRSDDDGRTFSEPVEITPALDQFRKDYAWKVVGTGPAHGIQLRSGRLLVPLWLSTGTGGHAHRPSVVATIYSDDQGKTWHRGDIVVHETEPLRNPSETVVAELADGRVMLNMRSESPQRRRAVVIGPDGATRWGPIRFDEQLVEPICMASLVRLSTAQTGGKNRLLFANPHSTELRDPKAATPVSRRQNLTVKLSYDEGQTWPMSRSLEPGPSGYSDLAVGPDGTIYCFYERGAADGSGYATKYLCLARFNLEWLSDGKDQLPRAAKK